MNSSSGISYIGNEAIENGSRLSTSVDTPSNSNASYNQNSNSQIDSSKEINIVRQTVVRDLSAMLQGMFDGIDDSFFELANNAHSNNEQNRFFEAMRDIRIKRKGVESSFNKALNELFSRNAIFSTNKPIKQNNSDFDSLSLVQNDTLEEEVAISSMATKAQANFQGPLLQFDTRLANLYQARTVKDIQSPLDPKELAQAFADACACIEIEIKEKLIVLKQFDRYVLSNLGIVLEEANKIMIGFGIIPQFKNQGLKSSTHNKVSGNHSTENTDTTQTEASLEASNRRQAPSGTNNDVLANLHTLLANVRSHNPHSLSYNSGVSIPPNSETKFVSTQDLIGLLSAIQEGGNFSSGEAAHDPKVVNIQHELKTRFSNTSNSPIYPTFKQVDEDIINLVAMLFEFILEDYNLSPSVQVLISRLQIPILKVVIQDNTFFSNATHPARKLLNTLAKSGVSCQDGHNKKDKLFEKIEHTVTKIVEEFSGDIALFDKLYKEFNEFIVKEDKRSKIVEQRTKESEIGQIKSRLAQKSVEETLETLMSQSIVTIPEVISETLQGGWSRVMFLAKLKDEQEHQWLQTCNIAEELIWCLQPFQSPKDKQRWIATAPKLLKNLKTGLEEVSYNSTGLDQTIIEVRNCITSAFKHNSLHAASEISGEHIVLKEKTDHSHKTAIEKQQEVLDSKFEKFAETVDTLEPGTWVEFTVNGKTTRSKLSLMVTESQSYIFVNRMGLQAKEIERQELIRMYASKEALTLSSKPIIDRALSALTSNLQQKASA